MTTHFEVITELPPFVPVSQHPRDAGPFGMPKSRKVFDTREEAERYQRAGESQWSGYSWSIREMAE